VKHDNDIRIGFECLQIAGLLITTVAPVLHVHNGLYTQTLSDFDCLILAYVVHEDNVVNNILGNVSVGLLQSFGSIIGRHDHDNFHLPFPFVTCLIHR
jgi:hypothetical protein